MKPCRIRALEHSRRYIGVREDPPGSNHGPHNVIAAVIQGLLIAGTHAAPADGDLIGGECVLWFDQTNGVGNTKLMLKGKSADGTVKTATILLA